MMALDPEAQFNTLVADVQLQQGWEEAGLNESEANLTVNTQAAEKGITEAEPGTYRNEENAANRGGLLHSGTSGRRQTDIAANFAARRAANERSLAEGKGRIKHEREGGALKRTERLHGGEGTRAAEEDQYNKEHPAAAPTRFPGGGYVGQSQGAAEHPGQWVGNVRVGGAPSVVSSKPQPITRATARRSKR